MSSENSISYPGAYVVFQLGTCTEEEEAKRLVGKGIYIYIYDEGEEKLYMGRQWANPQSNTYWLDFASSRKCGTRK